MVRFATETKKNRSIPISYVETSIWSIVFFSRFPFDSLLFLTSIFISIFFIVDGHSWIDNSRALNVEATGESSRRRFAFGWNVFVLIRTILSIKSIHFCAHTQTNNRIELHRRRCSMTENVSLRLFSAVDRLLMWASLAADSEFRNMQLAVAMSVRLLLSSSTGRW